MGLDIYVGSFTRYYAGDWETVVARMSREAGIRHEIIRPNKAEDAITDPSVIRPDVVEWRVQLSRGLGSNITEPLDWDESAAAPYFTDKPAWDCYASLLLWAAYAEQPDLARPHDCVEDWMTDPAYQRSSDPTFDTAFSQLLSGIEAWLPCVLPFVFAAPTLTGHEQTWGSSVALVAELEELNARTWQASEATRAAWRRESPEHLGPLEIGARFAYAIMVELGRLAVSHKLVMMLDY